MAALLTPFHIRGLADSVGSPGATIATVAIDQYADGKFRFTIGGKEYDIGNGDTGTALLLETLFGVTGLIGTP